jgi:hypothetical protein
VSIQQNLLKLSDIDKYLYIFSALQYNPTAFSCRADNSPAALRPAWADAFWLMPAKFPLFHAVCLCFGLINIVLPQTAPAADGAGRETAGKGELLSIHPQEVPHEHHVRPPAAAAG